MCGELNTALGQVAQYLNLKDVSVGKSIPPIEAISNQETSSRLMRRCQSDLTQPKRNVPRDLGPSLDPGRFYFVGIEKRLNEGICMRPVHVTIVDGGKGQDTLLSYDGGFFEQVKGTDSDSPLVTAELVPPTYPD